MYIAVYPPFCLSVCLSVCLSFTIQYYCYYYLSALLSVCLSVCLSVRLAMMISFFITQTELNVDQYAAFLLSGTTDRPVGLRTRQAGRQAGKDTAAGTAGRINSTKGSPPLDTP
jgi:hypothetical protein